MIRTPKASTSWQRNTLRTAAVVFFAIATTVVMTAGAYAQRMRSETTIVVPRYSAGAATNGSELYLSQVGFSGPGLVNAYSVPGGSLLRQNSAYPGMLFELAYDPARNVIFAADGWGIHVYNAADMSYAGYIDVGASTVGLAFEPKSGRLFAGVRGTTMAGDRAVFVIDPSSGARIAEIASGAVYATNLAVDLATGRVLVGEHGRIRIFDGSSLQVLADLTTPLAASDSLYALHGQTIFLAGKRSQDVVRVDATTGSVIDSASVGPASAIALDAKGKTLWVSHRAAGAACDTIDITCPYVVSKFKARDLSMRSSGSEALLDYPYPQYHHITVVGKRAVFTAFRSEKAVIS
ncbi:MAG: hypothetical protein C4318_02935 [Acidimicrobiia bacterium]